MKKLLALLLAVLMLAPGILLPAEATASAAAPQASIITGEGRIWGVDYTRLSGGVTRKVKLDLGGLIFYGELTGANAPSMEEINRIVAQVMQEQGVSSSDVLNSSAMADFLQNAEGVTGVDFIKQLANFIPLGIGGIAIDTYDTIVDANSSFSTGGKVDAGTAIGVVKDTAQQVVESMLTKQAAVKGASRVVRGSAKIVPVAGQILTAVEIYINLMEQQEQFIQTIKFIEQRLATFANFYATCNRRINELGKGESASSVIRFENATARYEDITFWGIKGLANTWMVNGTLRMSLPYRGSDIEGDYAGALLIEIDGLDGLDAKFFQEQNFRKHSVIFNTRSMALAGFGGNKLQDSIVSDTHLKRTLIREYTIKLMMDNDNYELFDINWSDLSDETQFNFAHTISGYGEFVVMGQKDWCDYAFEMSSTDPTVLDMFFKKETNGSTTAGVTHGPYVGMTERDNGDLGTLWMPLDAEATMVIVK